MNWLFYWSAFLSGIAALVVARHLWIKRIKSTPLRANCLITKYPILILHTQGRYLSSFSTYSRIARHLHEHGYEVLELNMINKPIENQSVSYRLNKLILKYGRLHVFADSQATNFLQAWETNANQWIASQNQLDKKPIDEYLNTAILLAENDLKCCH